MLLKVKDTAIELAGVYKNICTTKLLQDFESDDNESTFSDMNIENDYESVKNLSVEDGYLVPKK
jgi:hypothetical protein